MNNSTSTICYIRNTSCLSTLFQIVRDLKLHVDELKIVSLFHSKFDFSNEEIHRWILFHTLKPFECSPGVRHTIWVIFFNIKRALN